LLPATSSSPPCKDLGLDKKHVLGFRNRAGRRERERGEGEGEERQSFGESSPASGESLGRRRRRAQEEDPGGHREREA